MRAGFNVKKNTLGSFLKCFPNWSIEVGSPETIKKNIQLNRDELCKSSQSVSAGLEITTATGSCYVCFTLSSVFFFNSVLQQS